MSGRDFGRRPDVPPVTEVAGATEQEIEAAQYDYEAAGFVAGDTLEYNGQRFNLQHRRIEGGDVLVPILGGGVGGMLLDKQFWPPAVQAESASDVVLPREQESQSVMPDFSHAASIADVWHMLRQYIKEHGNLAGVQAIASGSEPLAYLDVLQKKYERMVQIIASELEVKNPDEEVQELLQFFSSANNLRIVIRGCAYLEGHNRGRMLQEQSDKAAVQEIDHERGKAEFEKQMEQWLSGLPDGCVIKLHSGDLYRKSENQFTLHVPKVRAIKPDGRALTLYTRYLKSAELARIITASGQPEQWGRVEYMSGPEKVVLEPIGGEKTHREFAAILPLLYPDVVAGAQNSRDAVEAYFTESQLGQRRVGDCFHIASLKGLKDKPALYFDTLAQSIRRDGDVWKVRFLGSDFDKLQMASQTSGIDFDDGWITITDKDVAQWKKGITINNVFKQGAEGDLADILLERARFSYASRVKILETGATMELDPSGNLAGEGGTPHRVLDLMLSDAVAMKRVVGEYKGEPARRPLIETGNAHDAESLVRDFAANPDLFVVTLESLASAEERPKPLVVRDVFGDDVEVRYRHGFTLLDVDLEEPITKSGLVIQDPHIGSKPFELPLSEALKAFRCFSYVQLHGEYKPYREVYEKGVSV